MKEYILITIMQALGFGFQVGFKLKQIDGRLPNDTIWDVVREFIYKDRVSMYMSILVLALNYTVHFIIADSFPATRDMMVTVPIFNWLVPFKVLGYIISFFMGYFGQWVAYKVFGKAEQYVNDKLK